MRRLVFPLLAATLLAAATIGTAAAQGPQPGHLGDHGWDCFFVEDLGVHCAPPGSDWPPPLERQTPLLYWFVSGEDDVDATDLDFTGTEMLTPNGRYHEQPCPQEGLVEYAPIGIARACHHN